MNLEQGEGKLLVVTGKDGWLREARMVQSTGSKTLDAYTEQFVLANWHGPAGQRRVIIVNYGLTRPGTTPVSYGEMNSTPAMNAYGRTVREMLGRRLSSVMKSQVKPGESVRVGFEVTDSGKPTKVRVLAGKEYQALATASVSTVLGMRFRPIPLAVREEMRRQHPTSTTVECSFTFSPQ